MWYVYILESKNSKLYTGITNNIQKRITVHKEGKGARFTRAFGVKALVHCENARTRSVASKREAQIKRLTRKEKLKLIARGA